MLSEEGSEGKKSRLAWGRQGRANKDKRWEEGIPVEDVERATEEGRDSDSKRKKNRDHTTEGWERRISGLGCGTESTHLVKGRIKTRKKTTSSTGEGGENSIRMGE